MKKVATFLLCCLSFPLFAQFVPEPVNPEYPSHPQLSEQFDTWRAENDYSEMKGWKAFARELEFRRSRLNPGGISPDLADLKEAAIDMANYKANAKTAASASWSPLGPFTPPTYDNVIGRINCIEFHPTDPNTFWVGVAQGGVWKTTNAGQSWTPLTDNLPILRISDIEVDPNNHNIMYISVGDYAYLGVGLALDGRDRNTHYGLGVYKTIDGGITWNPTGLSFSQQIRDRSLTRRVYVNPANSQELVAGGIHGLWKSTDGGTNWTMKEDTIIWDLEMDPSNPNILYASSGYLPTLGIGEAHILKSTNFGDTWTYLNTPMIPTTGAARIELAVAPSDGNYVYAIMSKADGGLQGFYRSIDAGQTWTTRMDNLNILHWYEGNGSGGQGWYDLVLHVHPSNKEVVYAGGVNLWGTTDGGLSWEGISNWQHLYINESTHADLHQLKVNPLNNKWFLCNDGGLERADTLIMLDWATHQAGTYFPTVWTDLSPGMNTSSYYRLGSSEIDPNLYVAGAQDNGTVKRDQNGNWTSVGGGDGMECFFSNFDTSKLYTSSQYGYGYLNGNYIAPTFGQGEWTTPWMMNNNGNQLYFGDTEMWLGDTEGLSWQTISNFGYSRPISHFDVAPSTDDYIYMAYRPDFMSGNGLSEVWVTTNGGTSWDFSMNGLPDSLYPNYFDVDELDPNKAWLVMGGMRDGQKVYETTDAGVNWTNISKNLPNIPVNCIMKEAGSNDRLYIGTDIGVYYTEANSNFWTVYSNDLPNVIVTELAAIYGTGDIIASTFGRGLWRANLVDSTFVNTNENVLELSTIELYPNPVTDQLKFEFTSTANSISSISIVSVTGAVVYQESVVAHKPQIKKTIDLDVPSGMYFLILHEGNTTHSKKFLKLDD